MVDFRVPPTGEFFRTKHSPAIHGITIRADSVLITFNKPHEPGHHNEANRDKAVEALLAKGFTLESNADDMLVATSLLPPTQEFRAQDVTTLLDTLNGLKSSADNTTPLLHADDVLAAAQFFDIQPTRLRAGVADETQRQP
jgi:hypothetical protein